MAFSKVVVLLYLGFFISCNINEVLSARNHPEPYNPPNLKRLTDLFPTQTYKQGFSDLFGTSNIKLKENGTSVDINLDKYTGSGFISQNRYHYGFFSAAMKLPAGSYSAGVVVAFYLSNADVYPRSHDEIDFELLGHSNTTRKEWILQTNVYGNGSVRYTGREEKFRVWFDPTKEFHTYSVVWNSHHIVFLVDNIPLRQIINTKSMSPAYPSKPMSLYATIWDGSGWATDGGRSRVDYNLAPFTSSFRKLQVEGCILNKNQARPTPPPPPAMASSPTPAMTPTPTPPPIPPPSPPPPPPSPVFLCSKSKGGMRAVEGEDVLKLTDEQKKAMDEVREKFMTYSYCKDTNVRV